VPTSAEIDSSKGGPAMAPVQGVVVVEHQSPAGAKLSVRALARLVGVLYLVVIAGGLFSEVVVRSRLIVDGDAPATAANLVSEQQLFRIGFMADLVMFLSDVALAVLFYVIFKPVSRIVAMMAAAFRLTQTAIIGANLLHMFAALVVLRDADYLRDGFAPEQIDGIAMLLLDLHAYGYVLGLTFFGLNVALLGYLVYRSGFAPRSLGIVLVVAAAGYLADSVMFFLVAGYDGSVSPFVLAPAVIAEVWLCLWLLSGAIDPNKWEARAVPRVPLRS
jgi:hypothetical protein